MGILETLILWLKSKAVRPVVVWEGSSCGSSAGSIGGVW